MWQIGVEGSSTGRGGISEESIQGRQRLDEGKKEMRVSHAL